MRFSNLNIAGKISVGGKIILVVIAVIEVALFFAFRELDKMTDASVQSFMVRAELERSFAAAEDMIASSRGFVITQNPRFVSSYENAVKTGVDALNAARAAAAGQADVLAGIDKIGAAIAAYEHDVGDPQMQFSRDPQTIGKAVELAKSERAGELRRNYREAGEAAQVKVATWSQAIQKVQDWTTYGLYLALVAIACVTIGFALAIGRWLKSWITAPLADMTEAMNKLAAGDNSITVPSLGWGDEMGQMAKAVQTFKKNAIEQKRLASEAADARRMTEAERQIHEAEKAKEAEDRQLAITMLGQGLGCLANGDLMHRIETPFAESTEKLRSEFNVSVEQLQKTMLTIISNAEAIRSGTGEISMAADDLSRRTEQQAANLEETAAALDQITATVRKTADGATHARDVVSSAKADADKGGEVVRLAIGAMSGIEKSSQQIGQIIGVIDEIAFQTNLLALNAGVEAARAGDAGRGFAVVASEVRALAQRSAEAAKEIKSLIAASTAQVDQGVDLVAETGKALERIVAQVADINNVVSEIAASAHEQATGLKEVNAAVNQMDQVTQQNAAMVEQTTAAAYSLNQETEKLTALVSRFQVGHSQPMRSASPKPGRQSAPALKTVAGRGGSSAVRKHEAVAEDGWEEF
ncbi:methyl-accepting chemotaxis protein [Methyloferula stellata]|uniref:methyl-accepting chemotaxis protein n=1 Tax=Methyloferula stellata TaxID=876270 RepID=UPI0003711F96|nr:methyl-accepting chemotaxis protein [Methyloferula stellata]